MAKDTSIAWTRSTFNPWIGCTRVSPGCDHCYAEALDRRVRYGGGVHWGAGVPRYRTSEKNWAEPLKWDTKAALTPHEPWLVFCASLADFADNEVPEQWRIDLENLIARTRYLSWLLVTKRIGNVAKLYSRWAENGFPDNVRVIASVVDQAEADRDIPKLLSLNCKNGISYEPALGPVNWAPWVGEGECAKSADGQHCVHWYDGDGEPCCRCGQRYALQWVIVGGESDQGGAKARPFNVMWARSTIEQCHAAGVPVFVKQLGSMTETTKDGVLRSSYTSRDSKADPAGWPEDLQIQEFPA